MRGVRGVRGYQADFFPVYEADSVGICNRLHV